MVVIDTINITNRVFNNEYVSQIPTLVTKDLGTNLLNLFIYVIGMVIYGFVVWFYYRNLAKRDLLPFRMKVPDKGFFAFLERIWGFIHYILKSLIFYPFITSIWFIVLGAFLLFLSKSNDVSQILLMTMTIIASARITAYFSEDLAKDISKMIPFALLGVFIVDQSYFSWEDTIAKFYAIPTFIHIIIQYFIAIVILEFILNSCYKLFEYATRDRP